MIAGLVPKTDDAQKSLELYRSNLRDVLVITFDELLSKLMALAQFLSEGGDEDRIAPRLLGDDETEDDKGRRRGAGQHDYEYDDEEEMEEDDAERGDTAVVD